MGQDTPKWAKSGSSSSAGSGKQGLFSRVKSALGVKSRADEPPSDFLSSIGFEQDAAQPEAEAAPSSSGRLDPVAARPATDSRHVMSRALIDLMKSKAGPHGQRHEMNYLFILNQNLMTMGEMGVRDTPHRVLFQALAQLDAAADYSTSEPLHRLRMLLVNIVGLDPAHSQSQQTQAAAARSSAAIAARTAAAPRDIFSEPVQPIPVATATEIPVPELTDAFDEFGPNLTRDASGPEVMEGHGLEPYEPVTLEDLDVKLGGLQDLRTGRGER